MILHGQKARRCPTNILPPVSISESVFSCCVCHVHLIMQPEGGVYILVNINKLTTAMSQH